MSTQNKIMTAGIVDDDEIFTFGFKKFAQNRGLFDEILTFSNGREAINFLKANENMHHLPDVLFVDINMPIMDGWEFNTAFEEIKAQLGKIITLYNISSSIDLDDIKRAKDNPIITDYLLKPIEEEYLNQIVKDLHNPTDKRRYN